MSHIVAHDNFELGEKMLIARNGAFGPPAVVRLALAPIPTPKRDQILVRVHATTVSAADWRLRSRNVPRGFGFVMGLLFGFRRPKYEALGTELAGEVVALGEGVKNFKIGDRLVANLGMKLGGHAQFKALNESSPIARIPLTMSYTDAAALVFGGTTALAFLRDKLKLKTGEKLLVIGAGGAVGSAAVQLGREMGANVTGVCSTDKAQLVAKLGANRVIDYRGIDWRAESDRYDAILDTVGGTTFENTRHKLTAQGRLGLVVADLPLMLKSAWISLTQKQKIFAGPVAETSADLQYLVSLCEQGRFKPLIGEILPLERIVEGHQRVESGHKTGNVVIVMGPSLDASLNRTS